jgi:hypothetical protein
VALSLSPDGNPRFELQKTTLILDQRWKPFQGLFSGLKKRLDSEGLRIGAWPECMPKRPSKFGNAFYIAEKYGPKVSLFSKGWNACLQPANLVKIEGGEAASRCGNRTCTE